MSVITPDDWSPADHPDAIAVSEAQWWRSAVRLAAARLKDDDDPRSSPMSSRQIDARFLVLALAQLLNAERLEQVALAELGFDSTVGRALSDARSSYVQALPGIQEMRNAITHYDDWSQGKGRGSQKRLISAGDDRRAVARDYWAFGYDPSAHTVSLGPHSIDVETAVRAAANLARAIYAAAREVDNHRSETQSSDR